MAWLVHAALGTGNCPAFKAGLSPYVRLGEMGWELSRREGPQRFLPILEILCDLYIKSTDTLAFLK